MAGRIRSTAIKCAEPGCTDCRHPEYSSRHEYDAIMERQKRTPYRCTRHDKPEQVLRPDNQQTMGVLVATRLRSNFRDNGWIPGLFWVPEGGTSGSGFTYGPGFKAHANDFPEGTRLVVTARVELPEVPA